MSVLRRPADCPDDLPSPKLLFPGRGGMAVLVLTLANSLKVRVRLDARLAKILVILNDWLCRDREAGIDEDLCGWMTDRQIAEQVVGGDPRGACPEPSTITAYRCRINRLIRKATPRGVTPPQLWIVERLVGVRLVLKIDITRCRRA